MGTDVATFTGDEHDPAAVIARLAGMGFEFGPSRVVIRSLLDTFDGRLSRAGLRLELRESDGLELVLTGKGSAGAHLTVTSVPRFAADLPPGPFRSRLVALAEVGLSRVNGDTLTIAAAASGAHLEGASRRAGVPLDPMMPAIVGFRAVLADLADTVVANWPGTVERLDPEFLHDMRVAVRRTRTVLAEGKKVLPPTVVERAEERFGWLGSVTGPVRDLDVHLINWATDTDSLARDVVAALEPVHLMLERQGESAHHALAHALDSAEAAELMTTAGRWWREPTLDDRPGVDADRPLGKIVTKRIARAHANLVERGRLIHPHTPSEQIHDLRKDAKKLRYLLECFGGLLHDAPRKAFVRRLKSFQDSLGEHHDAAIHVAALRTISRELHSGRGSPETMLAIGQLIAQIDQRRVATRLEFAEHFAAYDTKATRRDLDAALAGVNR